MDNDYIASAIFYPAVILAVHYFYVAKRHHPDWVPWRATGRFLWALVWPVFSALVVVVAIIYATGNEGENFPQVLAGVLCVLVVFPAFGRARRLITEPPKKRIAS